MGGALASAPSSPNDQDDPPLCGCRRNGSRIDCLAVSPGGWFPNRILCRDSLAEQLCLSGRQPHVGLPDRKPAGGFQWAKLVTGKWYRYRISRHTVRGQANRTANAKPMGRRSSKWESSLPFYGFFGRLHSCTTAGA